LVFEGHSLTHAADRRSTALKRMAIVMLGELRMMTVMRFVLLALGGVVLPLASIGGYVTVATATIAPVLLLLGELSERYLFFRAAPASRMPGGLR
jgi:DMSO reductase anchor subunit